MAYPGSATSPGDTTWPGVTTPPGTPYERDVPELAAAPQGVNPRDALLVKLLPPTGKGAAVVRDCPADLTFDNAASGGYGALSCTIDWAGPPPDALSVGAVTQVIDRRNGNIVWYGHLVDPGYTRTGTGASHRIAATGFSSILDTQVGALAYVDRDLAGWTYAKDYPAGAAQVVDDLSLPAQPSDWVDPATSVLQLDIPEGSKLDASTPTHMTVQYLAPKYNGSGANQDIILVQGVFDGTNSADYRVKARVVTAAGTVDTVMDRDYTSTARDFRLIEGVGTWDIPNARVAQLRWEYAGGADAVASRDYFLRWGNLAVVFQRLDRAGNLDTTPTVYLQARHIIDDVIGRLLASKLDISTQIETPDALVEQACWWGGISARGVFDWLEDLVPDCYWAVWGPQADSQPRFEYTSWRQPPRYVIPPDSATIQLAGGGDDLINRAVVAYQTSNGVPASVVVVGDVPELDAAGLQRSMLVDLTGEGPLSTAGARAKGLDALRTQNIVRSSGTATVTGPVMDLREGRVVEPWEIRAGWPVVLAGGALRADGGRAYSLTGARDGRSTFRLTGAAYTASSGSAELTLDGGGRNLFNRVRRPLPAVRARRKRSQRYHAT